MLEKTLDALKTEAEIGKLMAETMKLHAENVKLSAEARKLQREARFSPLLAIAAFATAVVAVAHFFHP